MKFVFLQRFDICRMGEIKNEREIKGRRLQEVVRVWYEDFEFLWKEVLLRVGFLKWFSRNGLKKKSLYVLLFYTGFMLGRFFLDCIGGSGLNCCFGEFGGLYGCVREL